MRYLLTSGSFYTSPVRETFQLAKEAGFDGMNLMITREFQDQDEVKLVEELQTILPIDSIHVPFINLWGWGNPIEKIERTVHLAIKTGVSLVNFHPPGWLLLEIGFCVWFLRIQDFQRDIGENQVKISIENMPHLARYLCDPHLLSRTPQLRDFLTKRNLNLTFDTSHMGTKKVDFLEDFRTLYDTGRIRQIQYSDYRDGREHLKPGDGVLPLNDFLALLVRLRYTEGLCLELMKEEFPHEKGEILKSLRAMLDEMKRHTQ